MENIDISIIIPSYNSQKTIDLCLSAIKGQKRKHSYEIIVVDCSLGKKVDNIVVKYQDVIFIKEAKRFNPGIGRNIGAKVAKGELLIFIDSDVIIAEDFLENAFRYYRLGHYVFVGSIDIFKKRYLDLFEKLEWFLEFAEFKPSMKEGTRWCLPSYALAIKKQIFEENEFLGLQMSQDAELTVRLREKGNVLYFNPRLKVFHIFHSTPVTLFKKFFIFGVTNAQIRILHNVSGSKIVNNKILALPAIPLFAVIKLVKISWRNIRFNQWYDKILYIALLPFVICLIGVWMLGFYAGSFSEKRQRYV